MTNQLKVTRHFRDDDVFRDKGMKGVSRDGIMAL
jgi:hypothetical protein